MGSFNKKHLIQPLVSSILVLMASYGLVTAVSYDSTFGGITNASSGVRLTAAGWNALVQNIMHIKELSDTVSTTTSTLSTNYTTLNNTVNNATTGLVPRVNSIYTPTTLSNILSGSVSLLGGNNIATTLGTNNLQPLTLETNNLPRLTVTAAGDIGVGTTTPGVRFDINGQGRSVGSFTVLNPSNTSASVSLGWLNDVSRIRVGGTGTGASNGFDVQGPGDTSLLRILSNGNIGVSNSNPTAKLDVAGSIRSTTSFLGNASDTVSAPSFTWSGDENTGLFLPAADTIGITTAGSEKLRIDSTGNIGIGTTAPASKLHVVGSIRSTTNFLGNASDTVSAPSFTWSGDENTGLFLPAADTIGITTAGSEKIRVNSNGNVGIGTTNPLGKLDVIGGPSRINTTVWGYNWLQSNGPLQAYRIASLPANTSSSYDHIVLEGVFGDGWHSSVKSFFKIYMGNRNGFNYQWQIQGDIRTNTKIQAYLEADNSISIWAVLNANTWSTLSVNIPVSYQVTTYPSPTNGTPSGSLVFDTSSSSYQPQVTVNSLGNMGIGTSTPASRLEVVGQVKITGGSPGVGKVLTSDASGLATWSSAGTALQIPSYSIPLYGDSDEIPAQTKTSASNVVLKTVYQPFAQVPCLMAGQNKSYQILAVYTDNLTSGSSTLGFGGSLYSLPATSTAGASTRMFLSPEFTNSTTLNSNLTLRTATGAGNFVRLHSATLLHYCK